MANTVTQTTDFGGGSSRRVLRTIVISSDGTEETDLVIFDHSAFANSSKYASVENIQVFGKAAAAATAAIEFDATSDDAIVSGSINEGFEVDYSRIGGKPNPGSTGVTGDIVLTTTGLASGDIFTVKLLVKQRGI